MDEREHSNGYIVTKEWPMSKAVNSMIIDRKEAETLVKQLEKLLKPAENTEN